MCRIFIDADPDLYKARSRSLRLQGAATSLRLENLFWSLLEEIASRDGMRVPQLINRLYDELCEAGGDVTNFTSFLRVSCTRYLALQGVGAIPGDRHVAIGSLDADHVLSRDPFQTATAH